MRPTKPGAAKDERLLEALKEQSRKLKQQRKNGFIAYTWDVSEAMRRIHDLEQRLQTLEALEEARYPDEPDGPLEEEG